MSLFTGGSFMTPFEMVMCVLEEFDDYVRQFVYCLEKLSKQAHPHIIFMSFRC